MADRPAWLQALTTPGEVLAAGLRAVPEVLTNYGGRGELKQAAPPIHINMPDIAVRPQVMLLWNGVPLQELGIDTALASVSFTTTVGRSKPTKKFAFGKPKVGGASIVFILTDERQSEVLARLLHSDTKPNISIAFGYEQGKSYWAGSFNAAQVVDGKKFKKASSFKVDRVTWEYNSSGVPKVTINGVSDKAVQLTTNVSPRVYTNENLRRIFEGVADENGLILDVDPDLPLDARMSQVIKGSNETDLEMLSRLANRMGADLYLVDGIGEYGAAGVTNRFKVSGDPAAVALANEAQLRDTVRGILRVSKLPGFMDLSKFEQARPLVIGYGAFLDEKQRKACDVLAVSVSISDVRQAGGGGSAGSKIRAVNPDNGAITLAAATGSAESNLFFTVFTPGVQELISLEAANRHMQTTFQGQAGTMPSPDKLASQYRESGSRSQPVKNAHAVGLPKKGGVAAPAVAEDIEPTGLLTSAQMASLALRANFNFEVSITITPGIPYIQAPFNIELLGTRAHDGAYGVEEATTSWAGSGLTTTLKCKPVGNKVGSGGGGKPKPKDGDWERVLAFSTGAARDQNYFVRVKTGVQENIQSPFTVKEREAVKDGRRTGQAPERLSEAKK